jgi:hypothetical protein
MSRLSIQRIDGGGGGPPGFRLLETIWIPDTAADRIKAAWPDRRLLWGGFRPFRGARATVR